MRNLEGLAVSSNIFEGEIPNILGSCIKLERLWMQGNLFKCLILSSLSSLRGLKDLDLYQKNLSSEIPEFFVEFELLQNLNLSYNNLEGIL